MNITNRAFWCWLFGHRWQLLYLSAAPSDPIKVCQHCGLRKEKKS